MKGEPADPLGNGSLEIWARQLKQWIKNYAVLDISNAKRKPQPGGGVIYEIKPTPPIQGGGDFRWQKPNKELDPSLSVTKGAFVYITSGNVLVTTGMTDLVTNENVISCEGMWQAAKNIPAAADGKYNVPVFPYPSATGTVSGSAGSLKGDLDNDGIFWIYWGQVAC